MDRAALVEPDIAFGRLLLQQLDKSALKPAAALWLYMPEFEEWRLLIASALVDKKGAKKGYSIIHDALQRLPEYADAKNVPIMVVGHNDKLIQLLLKAIRTAPDSISGIRFSRNVINNVLVEDAYIYRMT